MNASSPPVQHRSGRPAPARASTTHVGLVEWTLLVLVVAIAGWASIGIAWWAA